MVDIVHQPLCLYDFLHEFRECLPFKFLPACAVINHARIKIDLHFIPGFYCLRRALGNAGDEIVKKNVPVIISLDAISANIEEMQQLLLNYSIMTTKEEKEKVEEKIARAAATLKANVNYFAF